MKLDFFSWIAVVQKWAWDVVHKLFNWDSLHGSLIVSVLWIETYYYYCNLPTKSLFLYMYICMYFISLITGVKQQSNLTKYSNDCHVCCYGNSHYEIQELGPVQQIGYASETERGVVRLISDEEEEPRCVGMEWCFEFWDWFMACWEKYTSEDKMYLLLSDVFLMSPWLHCFV